jgi:arylsulfatase A-like enzyme
MNMTRRSFMKTSALAAGAALMKNNAFAMNPENTKPMNVIFVMTDQWRAHAIGHRKLDPVITPHLDAFSAASLSFNNAIASSPVCGPNRACWLTGRYLQNHGMFKNEAAHVQPEHLLSQYFKNAGYRNGYVGKWHLSGITYPRKDPTPDFLKRDYEFWYRAENHTHFDLRYDDHGVMIDAGDGWQPDHETDKAIQFLKNRDHRPFNLVLSYGPPHNGAYSAKFCPEKRWTPGSPSHKQGGYGYYAPKDYEALYKDIGPEDIRKNVEPVIIGEKGSAPNEFDSISGAIAGYYGACTAIDEAFGRLITYLKESGLYDNTIVVFSSDHGEMMGSHGLMTKGVCFEESINVPLMIHVPGVKARQDDRLFNSVDVMPTLMGLNGFARPEGVDGHDFSSALRDPKHGLDPEMAYIGYASWRGWRTKRHTYVTSTKEKFDGRESVYLRRKGYKASSHMLFDLENDPYQQRPIFKGDDAATDSLIDDFHHELYIKLKGMGETISESA